MPSACTQRLMVHADKNTAVILYTVYAFQECELTGMTVHYAGLMLVQPQSQLVDTPLITGQHTFGLFTILAETVGIIHDFFRQGTTTLVVVGECLSFPLTL